MNPQQLVKRIQKQGVRTHTKLNVDKVIVRKVNNKYLLGFQADGAGIGGVSEVEDEPEAFKGYILEKIIIPQLKMGLT